MKYTVFLVLIISFLGFSCSKKQSLENDQLINQTFSKSEIRDLEIILDFFENQICSNENTESENVEDCYDAFFKRMRKSEYTGSVDINIPYSEQEEMYKQISDSTFNQIWTFNKAQNVDRKDTLKSITYNIDGTYFSFLRNLGEEYPRIQKYCYTFIACGYFSPTMVPDLLVNYEEYNIDDIKIRLFVAIHYLTMYDQYQRVEKY